MKTHRSFVAADFLSVSPTLYVSDVVASAHWYETQLDFRVELSPPEPPHVAAILWRNEIRIALRQDEAYPPNGPIMYFGVKGLDAFYGWIKGRVEVTQALSVDLDGTRSFEITDPDGYLLAFVEEPDAA